MEKIETPLEFTATLHRAEVETSLPADTIMFRGDWLISDWEGVNAARLAVPSVGKRYRVTITPTP